MEETTTTSSSFGSGVDGNYESGILDPGLNLTKFIPELCKIAAVPFTNNNLSLLGERILTALREKNQQLERYEGLLAGFLQVKSLVSDSDTTPPWSEEPAVFFLDIGDNNVEGDSGPQAVPLPKSEELASTFENLGSEGTCQASGQYEMNSGELSRTVHYSTSACNGAVVNFPRGSEGMPPYDLDNQSTSPPPLVKPSSHFAPVTDHNQNQKPHPPPPGQLQLSPKPSSLPPTASQPPQLQQVQHPLTQAVPIPMSEEPVSLAYGQNEMNSGELSETANESSPVLDFIRELGGMSPQNSNLMPIYDPDNQYDENMREEFTPIRCQNSEQNEVPKKKIHEVYYLGGGIYRCQCSRRFTWEKAQKHFKKYYKADWKFMCEWCGKKFYDLSNLKLHLMKQHGMEKPGNKFPTENHVHDVHHSVPGVLSGLLGMTFFQRGRSPRQSGLPPTNPMHMDSEMDVVQGTAELGMEHQKDVSEMKQVFPPFTAGSSDPNEISELKVNVRDSQEERQLDKIELSEVKADTRLSSQMGKVEYPIGLMSGNKTEKRTRTPSRKYLENYWLEDYEDFP